MSDDTTQRSDDPECDQRKARINHDANGRPLGAAVFLAAEDIAALGIDPNGTKKVAYRVEAGDIRLTSIEQAVSDE